MRVEIACAHTCESDCIKREKYLRVHGIDFGSLRAL